MPSEPAATDVGEADDHLSWYSRGTAALRWPVSGRAGATRGNRHRAVRSTFQVAATSVVAPRLRSVSVSGQRQRFHRSTMSTSGVTQTEHVSRASAKDGNSRGRRRHSSREHDHVTMVI
jgi:hypothetical protein